MIITPQPLHHLLQDHLVTDVPPGRRVCPCQVDLLFFLEKDHGLGLCLMEQRLNLLSKSSDVLQINGLIVHESLEQAR
jgi:hypothetical protein